MLNSFWGKFGQRENLPQTEQCTNPDQLYKLLDVDSIEVQNIRFCTEDVIEVVYKNQEEQPLVILFHNLKGFDGIFLINSLYKAGCPMVRSLDETEQQTTWTKKVRQPIDIDKTRWATRMKRPFCQAMRS